MHYLLCTYPFSLIWLFKFFKFVKGCKTSIAYQNLLVELGEASMDDKAKIVF